MFLPNDIANSILEFWPYYELLEWIDSSKLSFLFLSRNLNAIHLLEKNSDKIKWDWLSSNPAAMHLLQQNEEKIHWYWLSGNPAAMHLLQQKQRQNILESFVSQSCCYAFTPTKQR